MSEKNLKYEFLKLEYTQCCSKIQFASDLCNQYVSYILTAIAAMAALLALCVRDEGVVDVVTFSVLFASGAIIICLLVIVLLHHLVQCYMLGGYVKHIEKIINRVLGINLLKWESSFVSNYIHKAGSSIFIYILCIVAYVSLLSSSAWITHSFIFPKWSSVAVVIYIVIVLELITAIIYVIKSFKAHKNSFKLFDGQVDSCKKPLTVQVKQRH